MKPTPAYDVEATMDAMPFLGPMVKAMNETGFGVFSFDHEGGDAQFEFDFDFAPALEMADKITFFRLMAKQIAKQNGLAVTFMPKPYTEAWGSGHHFNMSLVDLESGQNLFRDVDGPRGWSKTCYSFLAGILKHSAAIAAIATPTVNSYKRMVPRLSDGCISWAPVWAAYGDNNRSCMLRLPHNRPAIENRAVDSAANTYLASAFMLAAGLEGMADNLDPGEPIEDMTYDWSKRSDGVRLPRNLLEAIDAFEADPLTHEVFSPQFVSAYIGDEERRMAAVPLAGQRVGARALPEPLLMLVGLVIGRYPPDRFSMHRGYIDALVRARRHAADRAGRWSGRARGRGRAARRCDALIATGGGDLEPSTYGAESSGDLMEIDAGRDAVDLWAVQRVPGPWPARARHLPRARRRSRSRWAAR